MTDPAGIADLLRTARTTLREELVPHLPPAQRYAAAMVANALLIAARAVQAEPSPELLAAHRRLAPDRIAAREDMDRALARAIRAGDHDVSSAGALEELLRLRTRERLLVSNPAYLDQTPKRREPFR